MPIYFAKENINQNIKIITFGIRRFFLLDSYFSRDGIIELINSGLVFDKLRNADIPCLATCLRFPSMKLERFRLNDYSDDEITKLLLASSAIPMIFPPEDFQGHKYCDG